MKLFAAGIATETNTFCPVPTALDDFAVQRGKDVLAGRIDHPSLDLSSRWGKPARARGDDFVFSLMAWAEPSGITTRSTYESLRDEMLGDLRAAMPVDVVLLNLHGAMVAEGYDDCEEDMIGCVRAIVGPRAVIGVELDLHCHLREAMLSSADIVITFKEYPHVDIAERAKELFDLAVATKLGRIRPTMALFDCRMAGLYPTSRQPLRALVDALGEAERRPGVLSVSFGHGFPFADVPHMGSKVLVVTDNDAVLAMQVAQEFGLKAYALRNRIGFESLPMEQALRKALASESVPVVVADQSDNPGGGAPGDATYALRWLLDHQAEEVALGIFYDPEVVKIARKAGRGALLKLRLGGKLGVQSGHPVDLEATVWSLRDNYMHEFPQRSGESLYYALGDVVALRHGSIDIIVASKRCQCFSPSVFQDLEIDPKRKRLLVVKSFQHFYGGFEPMAGEVIYMAAPGAVSPDLTRLAFHRVDTNRLYPWVDDPLASVHP